MTGNMTYQQLHDKLKELGYSCRTAQVNGKEGVVLEHDTVPNAMIVLPQSSPEQIVEPFYLRTVLGILKSRGILQQEENPLLS